MKTKFVLLYFLFIGLWLQVNGQYHLPVYSSFHADPKGVFWLKQFDQPGYSSQGLRERMITHLKKNPALHDVKLDETGNIFASIRNMKIDYKRIGIPFIKTSNKVSYGRWKGKIKVEFADDQYRVVVENLEYFAKIHRDFPAGKAQAPQPEFESGKITKVFLNSDKSFFKHSSLKDLDLINFILTDQFRLIEGRLINPTEPSDEAVSAGH